MPTWSYCLSGRPWGHTRTFIMPATNPTCPLLDPPKRPCQKPRGHVAECRVEAETTRTAGPWRATRGSAPVCKGGVSAAPACASRCVRARLCMSSSCVCVCLPIVKCVCVCKRQRESGAPVFALLAEGLSEQKLCL